MSTHRPAFAAAGLVLGALIVLVLPASWLFVTPAAESAGGGMSAQYACPMFCVVMEEMPEDERCPVCGMELAAVSGESTLDPAERRMVGLDVTRLARVPLSALVRVVGEVDYDETRLSRITTRTAGWLTEVSVNARWEEVEKGTPLASIYSPELYAAQKEYLVAYRSGEGAGDLLLSAARRRLVLLGIGAEEIAALEKRGEAEESLTLRSPRDGVVITRNAVEGTAVRKGETLYAVADLSRVWIQAEVFERDLDRVRVSQTARLVVESSAEELSGKIAFIDPAIDRRTRTARVRIEVDNPTRSDGSRLLRIGQRVDAWIEARIGEDGRLVPPGAESGRDPLALPKSAVLRTGNRSVIYALYVLPRVGKPDYLLDPARLPETVLYEMVEVRVGSIARRVGGTGEGYYPVLDAGALPEGAAVVTRGGLLLDSQAQLSGKPSLLFPKGNRGGGGGGHEGH